jgi:hypothetical protein
MNIGYMIYQAERTLSAAEQRTADAQRGALARNLSLLLRRDQPKAKSSRTDVSLTARPQCLQA